MIWLSTVPRYCHTPLVHHVPPVVGFSAVDRSLKQVHACCLCFWVCRRYVPGMEISLSGRLKSIYSCHSKVLIPCDQLRHGAFRKLALLQSGITLDNLYFQTVRAGS